MVKEAKSVVKNLVRQRCVERFNSGVKELTYFLLVPVTYGISVPSSLSQAWTYLLLCEYALMNISVLHF
jgi:hypothetical protein